jgi:PAS domain S-box-containing protein
VTLAGSIRWIESCGELRSVAGKQVIGGLVLDITERKKSEEEVLASGARLEAALASMADAVFIVDADGRFTHFNEAFAAFQRFKNKEECAVKLPDYADIEDVFLPGGEFVPMEEWPVSRALRGETGAQREYIIKRRDGETYIASCNFAPIRDDSGQITGAVVTAREITEQKRSENRLRESEARLSSIIDTAADGIVVIDEKGTIQSANRACEEIFGYSPEELAGRHVSALMPSDLAAHHDGYLRRFSGRGAVRQVEAKRKDGAATPVDGAITEWRDSEGRRFFTGIFRDVSERIRNEEALADARRREAIGQLAGGVAHDFNNLLHVISGNLEIAQERVEEEVTRNFIQRARSAAEKGSALNRRLLSLARKRALKPEHLSLNERVEDTAKLLASTVGEHITVTTELAEGLWRTLADPGEIDSAILNLAANARDAMPLGGSIQITTSNITLNGQAAPKLHAEASPGNYVCLTIADDGVGMAAEVLERAIEPFFTTKGPGCGTGLGLASVADFARKAGGFTSIESAPGQGCAVSIYLPRTIGHETARTPSSALVRMRGFNSC